MKNLFLFAFLITLLLLLGGRVVRSEVINLRTGWDSITRYRKQGLRNYLTLYKSVFCRFRDLLGFGFNRCFIYNVDSVISCYNIEARFKY